MQARDWWDFTGQTVLITGGGGAIARGLALAFAERGASLALADVDLAKLASIQAEVEKVGRNVLTERLDVRDADAVQRFVRAVVDRFGAVDVLVNMAAVYERGPSEAFLEERFDRIVDINLKGTWLMCQAAGREMLARGHGRIINYASNAAIHGIAEQAAYNASKAGVVALTKTLAVEWARRGVTVNAVSPGPTETPMSAAAFADPAVKAAFAARIPMGELTPVEATVAPVLFLASEAARWVTGHTLFADGGMSAL
jgi:2-deoxy-D-gluconate 3-dehydrogenase